MSLLEEIRGQIRAGLAQKFPSDPEAAAPFRQPVGDPGLCGPDTVAWRVHGDLPAMMLGGVSALMLQMLHPKAMAGVYDHSDFREDPERRLRRTSGFIAVTTFAGREEAERLIAVVRNVHARVVGKTPDGEPYEANDPTLLTWVHTAEVASFLNAYLRYGPERLTEDEIDRYYDEVAIVAELLGAENVPKSAAAVRDYFAAMRPALGANAQSEETLDFLMNRRVGPREEQAVYALLMKGARDLLPDWAREALPVRGHAALDRLWVRPAAHALCSLLRWGNGPSPVVTASRERLRAVVGREAPA